MSCANCFAGHIHTGTPKGTLQDLHGYKTYVTLPPTDATPTSTIIFFSDAFGLYLVNNKLLADHYAAETGCRVVIPDIFPGGAATLGTMNAMNGLLRPIGEWYNYLNPFTYLGKTYNFVRLIGGMGPFFIYNAPPKVYPECLRWARDIRAEVPAGGKLGVAGFCWGGYQSTHLCKEADVEGGSKPLIDAQFSAHPSALKAPDDVVNSLTQFKTPFSVAVPELDFQFTPKVADESEAALKQKFGDAVGPYEFVVYKGAHHGFSVRASHDEGDDASKNYEDCAKQAVDWFNKYLK